MAENYDAAAGNAADGLAVPLRLHNLLLALAGRMDDSALSEARELVARSHMDDAAELTAGTLIAGRIPVRGIEQRELALVLEMSRSDATLADQLFVSDADQGAAHRFTGENQPELGMAEALDRTIHVLPDLRSVHAVWRNTPAGSVPGPLPQRVVLVEIGPEAHPPAVAYRVYAALRRAGLHSVVEVSGPWAERSAYHDSALAVANPVWTTGANSGGTAGPRAEETQGRPKKNRHVSPVARSEPQHAIREQPEQRAESGQNAEPQPSAATASIPPARQEDQPSVAATTDMSSAEVAQLRMALAEDPETGKAIASAKIRPGEVVEIPDLDLDDPQLSERDRQLLRELHAELAEREKAEAGGGRVNGTSRGVGEADRGRADGFTG
ncbi:hypothetical protein SAMN05216266_12724 [Amycolatopsis marina]|uniref:Uncharacterized protein n=1 Tax=Amycolatopsis marina TaxID=490629 RepID=A0A1I1CED3_9PSEU|nr:hypothetical protein [Amycolatopsis marina]SFB61045.1 hypothetical protein SAMN05216266_12724 [Amycolatopsis marina]